MKGYFPNNGTQTANPPDWCWAFQILPYVEQTAMFNTQPANSGVKIYMCPGRGRPLFASVASNTGGVAVLPGPYTDYSLNGVSFASTSQKVTLNLITNANGTSTTIFAGEKAMDRPNYNNTQSGGSIWDEPIYSGAWGSTARSAGTIVQDGVGITYSNNWGSPFSGVCPFVFCDGSVRLLPNGYDVTNALNWQNTTAFTLP